MASSNTQPFHFSFSLSCFFSTETWPSFRKTGCSYNPSLKQSTFFTFSKLVRQLQITMLSYQRYCLLEYPARRKMSQRRFSCLWGRKAFIVVRQFIDWFGFVAKEEKRSEPFFVRSLISSVLKLISHRWSPLSFVIRKVHIFL